MPFWAVVSFYNPKKQDHPFLKSYWLIAVDLQSHQYHLQLTNHAVHFASAGYLIKKPANMIVATGQKTNQDKFELPLKLSGKR